MADAVLGILGHQALEFGLSVRMECSHARPKSDRLLTRTQIDLLVAGEAFIQRRAVSG
jgi:hypothetical protein